MENEKASEAICEGLLSVLSDQMTERISQGFYARAGGYNLFCQDLENIVHEYNALAYKEVKIAEVLEKFLQEKVAVTTAILQADDKLTENERRICEEREKAVLLEQEIITQEERQRQLEEKMKTEQQNNEERVRQVIERMADEMSRQQQETKRAMESKLKEQSALMEKGFQEKADRMAWEIAELTRKNAEAEERVSRKYSQVILDQQRRNEQSMEVLRQQHHQQMQAINSRPRPASQSCSIQ